MQIGILGGGGWGIAIAKLLCENSHSVLIREYNPDFVRLLREQRGNPFLLPGVVLPEQVSFTSDLDEFFAVPHDLILTVVPSQYLRSVLQACRPFFDRIDPRAVINLAKGIEEHTLKRMSEILAEELPARLHDRIVGLSGPSLADEVAHRIPTTVVLAGSDDFLLQELQTVFSNRYFRTYRSNDLIGVEIGGAVKNIIAIAAGIIDGLGFGDNTKGALLTRGIVEIRRFGIACGAEGDTFLGLSGMGDLVTTAVSPHSRNRFVGNEIGKGRKLPEILAEMNAVAEGVATTRSVWELSTNLGVEMPIVGEIYRVLFEDKDPRQAIDDLMSRQLRHELR